MKKILAVQNPSTLATSMLFIGEDVSKINITVSKPNMNSDLGWINCMHEEIINCEFQVVSPLIADVSHIETKYHAIFNDNNGTYSLGEYLNELLDVVVGKVVIALEDSLSMEALLGEPEKAIKLVEVKQGDISEFENLVFRFRATDKNSNATVGYCIHNVTNHSIKCYISPIDFIMDLESLTYGYVGEVDAVKCLNERDILNADAINMITQEVDLRIKELTT
jgi:hypothetical protein